MTSICKSRAITISIFILIFLGGSLLHVHEASAEMKKVTGTSELLRRLGTDDSYSDQVRIQLINNIQLGVALLRRPSLTVSGSLYCFIPDKLSYLITFR